MRGNPWYAFSLLKLKTKRKFKSELTVLIIKETRQEDARLFGRLLRMTLS